MWAPLLIWRNTVAGAACAVCGICWLVALSARNLNPPQPVPASAASPRAILLPDTPGTFLTKNGKNRQMKTNAGKFQEPLHLQKMKETPLSSAWRYKIRLLGQHQHCHNFRSPHRRHKHSHLLNYCHGRLHSYPDIFLSGTTIRL